MPGEVEADEADLLVRCGVLHPPESPWPEQVSVRLPLAPGTVMMGSSRCSLSSLSLRMTRPQWSRLPWSVKTSLTVRSLMAIRGADVWPLHCGLCRLCEHSVSCVAGNQTTPTGDLSVSVVFYPISDYNPLTTYNEI